jgi:hypothetical protein
VEVRYGRLHNASLALISVGMVVVAISHFMAKPENAPTLNLNDARFVLFSGLAILMLYFAWLGASRFANREPQVVIDRSGIRLGFGRNLLIPWKDIQWARMGRVALRPSLQLGLVPEAFVAANLNLSQWSLDDNLRPVRGMPAAFLVRDNGLDTTAATMLDAIKAVRPNLIKS